MADLGIGSTLTFSGITSNLISIDGWSVERVSVETTHMGTTTAKTFIPSDIYDGGTLDVTVEFNGEAVYIAGAAATLTIDWGGAANTWSASAFVVSQSAGAVIEDRMTQTIQFKITGAIT